MKKTLALIPLLLIGTNVIGSQTEDCISAGDVMADAYRSEMIYVAFNERIDWQGVKFYSLPKPLRQRLIADFEGVKLSAANNANAIMEKIPEWNRQKMNGQALARDIIYGKNGANADVYVVNCLKSLD